MSLIPDDLQYTAEHEWVRLESDGSAVVGITDFAQSSLGDIVYVDLPAAGAELAAGGLCGEVESTKSVSEIYAPLAGEVEAVNEVLSGAPETVNSDPYGGGWLVRLRPSAGTDGLLDAAAYRAIVEQG